MRWQRLCVLCRHPIEPSCLGALVGGAKGEIGFATNDKQADKQEPGADDCFFEVSDFQEGPATLLLDGDFNCGGGGAGPWYTAAMLSGRRPTGFRGRRSTLKID